MKPHLCGAPAPANSLNPGANSQHSPPNSSQEFHQHQTHKKPHKTSLSSPFPVFSRDKHDGGGLGDEASATRRGCHHQLPADGGPDQLPGALTAAPPHPMGATQIPREQRKPHLGAAPWGERGLDHVVGREEEIKNSFFFFWFGGRKAFIQDMGL